MASKYIDSVAKPYLVSYLPGSEISILSTEEVISLIVEVSYFYSFITPKITLTTPDGDTSTIATGSSEGSQIKLDSLGTYSITYNGQISKTDLNGYSVGLQTYSITFNIAAVENRLPLKPWSITDVINRLLDLCEPIRQGEKPRFRLNGMDENGNIIPLGQPGSGQAALFDKIKAPQFALTRQTLRECLQEVGKTVHGEPRLKIKKDSAGYYYEVIYDLYASQEESNIFYKPYTNKGMEWIINNYLTTVDTNAENLINQLDKLGGVIVEPYENGAKTVRTENQYVRITDDNMIIATQYPVYTVDKLEYVYTDSSGTVQSVDITPYVFEKSEYDTRLSSYQEQYPYSKAYALYFSQGSKNIGGLNFKVESASSVKFKEYAIVNILKQLLGSQFTVGEKSYPLLAFRVTYTPIYSARVAQTKTNYKDFKYPAALIYNQQSNVIETRYYGENLKGVAARLGNIEKSYTYCLKWLKNVPRAGMLFRDGYYISAVAIEILPTYIRATLGVSKDFNRISSYIGVPSEKRYYEISSKQAIDRNVLYREYVEISTDVSTPDTDSLISNFMLRAVMGVFNASTVGMRPVTHVRAWGTSYKGNDLPAVDLPVVSSAFGNSVSFSWRYENNYSAGAVSQKVDNSAVNGTQSITGYWQTDARYCDYYGRMYYYNFTLLYDGNNYNEQTALDLPQSEPYTGDYGVISTVGKTPYILRKDNREALQINFQVDFVTNTDLIIGSALASYCPAVRGGTRQARLYVFGNELNKFTDHVEGWQDVKLDELKYVNVNAILYDGYFLVTAKEFPASGKSWAIVVQQGKGAAQEVEDEQGNPSSYQETIGGDLLIGRNQEVTAGQAFTPIYFTKKREIFDKTVWADIK